MKSDYSDRTIWPTIVLFNGAFLHPQESTITHLQAKPPAVRTGLLVVAAAAALAIALPVAAQEQVVTAVSPGASATPTVAAPFVGQTSLTSSLGGAHSAPTAQQPARAIPLDGSQPADDQAKPTTDQAAPAQTTPAPDTVSTAATPPPAAGPATTPPDTVTPPKAQGVPLWGVILIALVALLIGVQLARRRKSP